MNEQRLQQEPSMEEILASIRRIISEDEAASDKSRVPTGPTTPASVSGNGTSGNGTSGNGAAGNGAAGNGTTGNGNAPTARHGEVPPAADHAALYQPAGRQGPGDSGSGTYHAGYVGAAGGYAGDGYGLDDHDQDGVGDDTVLDLTEMVAEDGSVVTIAPVSTDAVPYDENGSYDDRGGYDNWGGYDDTLYADPARYDEAGRSYDARPAGEPADMQGDDRGHASAPGLDHGGGEPDPHGDYSEDDDAYDADGYDDVADDEPKSVLSGGPRETAVPADVEGAGNITDPWTVPADRGGVRPHNALAALAGGPGVDAAAKAAAPSEADEPAKAPPAAGPNADVKVVTASRSASSTGDTAPGTDAQAAAAERLENAPLEEMVREAIKPMLQEWLDNNLSRLVEDVARQELHRMIESRGGL